MAWRRQRQVHGQVARPRPLQAAGGSACEVRHGAQLRAERLRRLLRRCGRPHLQRGPPHSAARGGQRGAPVEALEAEPLPARGSAPREAREPAHRGENAQPGGLLYPGEAACAAGGVQGGVPRPPCRPEDHLPRQRLAGGRPAGAGGGHLHGDESQGAHAGLALAEERNRVQVLGRQGLPAPRVRLGLPLRREPRGGQLLHPRPLQENRASEQHQRAARDGWLQEKRQVLRGEDEGGPLDGGAERGATIDPGLGVPHAQGLRGGEVGRCVRRRGWCCPRQLVDTASSVARASA
mmetsp:Transcript_16528/g.46297  ORF Transcript_16528/g.46297 Transcript_16528/m.46297 type:complete len:293 (-) Transcript_16528:180-1058(-)